LDIGKNVYRKKKKQNEIARKTQSDIEINRNEIADKAADLKTLKTTIAIVIIITNNFLCQKKKKKSLIAHDKTFGIPFHQRTKKRRN